MKFDTQSFVGKNLRAVLLKVSRRQKLLPLKRLGSPVATEPNFISLNCCPKSRKSWISDFREKPFRIDGIFVKKGGQTIDVPIIYLESENIATTSHEEVYKLCCLNAPLKVMILCTEWDDQFWKKQITENHWHYIVDDFKDELSLTGYFAFIIAAWDETLKFHAYVLNENADLIEDDLLLEIK